jgi:DNA-binding NtrC family response regulator
MRAAVLIVDDEPGLRELLRRWLEAEQYVALEAQTAEDALEVLAQSPDVKVVIADLQMPGQGGAWLVDQMRQRFRSAVVVLATADDQVPGTLSLRPSVLGYLVKPLNREEVIRLVAEGVRKTASGVEPSRISTAADPIEAFLDRKLTHGDGDRDH